MFHLGSGVRTYRADFQIAHDDEREGVMIWVQAECVDYPPVQPGGERKVSVTWTFNHHPLSGRGLQPILRERGRVGIVAGEKLAIELELAAARAVFRDGEEGCNTILITAPQDDPRLIRVQHHLAQASLFSGLVDRVEQYWSTALNAALLGWLTEHPVPTR